MSVPDWWTLFLLFGASYRIYRLLAQDIILDKPRAWLVRLPPNWREGQAVGPRYRDKLAEFITCPWCMGFWVTIVWWVAWLVFPTEVVWASVPLTISTAVGMLHKLDND